jgi:hypothetical protein
MPACRPGMIEISKGVQKRVKGLTSYNTAVTHVVQYVNGGEWETRELKSDRSGTWHSTPRCSAPSGALAVHVPLIVGLNTERYPLGAFFQVAHMAGLVLVEVAKCEVLGRKVFEPSSCESLGSGDACRMICERAEQATEGEWETSLWLRAPQGSARSSSGMAARAQEPRGGR